MSKKSHLSNILLQHADYINTVNISTTGADVLLAVTTRNRQEYAKLINVNVFMGFAMALSFYLLIFLKTYLK